MIAAVGVVSHGVEYFLQIHQYIAGLSKILGFDRKQNSA